jgi:O-antigen/teichoic acid export membrane protein
LLAGSTTAFQASRLGTSLVAAVLLPPDRYAEWGIALALLAYSVYFNLGLTSGLNRELPRLLGKGEVGEARALEQSALSGAGLTAFLSWPFVAVLAVAGGLSPAMVVTIAVAAGAQQFYLFSQTSLRARLSFNRASLQQATLAVVFPAVAIPAVQVFGVAGLAIAQAMAFGVGAAFAGRTLWQPEWSDLRRQIGRLCTVGLPIMIGGLVFALLTTLDRWLVLVYLGDEATGQYTLAVLLSSAALLFSMVLAQQFYPRMALALGRGASPTQLLRMGLTQTAVSAAIVVPLVGALVLAAPELGRRMPDYAQSVDALRVLALGFVPLVASSGASNFLVVMGHPRRYLVVLVGAIATESIVAVQLVGMGLLGIAVAAASAYAYLLVGTWILSIRLVRR